MNTTTRDALYGIDYQGNLPLWKVFWGYGVLFSHIYFGFILTMYNRAEPLLMCLLLVGFMAYTLGIMRLVWINAFNTGKQAYGYAARYLTVFWMINSILVSLYLFMTYFGYWELLVQLP